VERFPALRGFLCQGVREQVEFADVASQLAEAVGA